MKARVVIGANYGDEGKGTVVAKYTKESSNVLNILTNGGSQRGHSILTKDGSITYQHFGSGTYYGADNYYSCFFILNPIQFTREHKALTVKPNKIYRDKNCKWTTIYDMMANQISEQQKKRHASCCMGIWNTIKRTRDTKALSFDDFIHLGDTAKFMYLLQIRLYYEKLLDIPFDWKDLWYNPYMAYHFMADCDYMYENTIVADLKDLSYDELIFENGQGLLLCDTGQDTYDTTPSNTGALGALQLLNCLPTNDVTLHYVSRTYLTRHGDGRLMDETDKFCISSDVKEDRTNHYNEGQGEFRYGLLNMERLHNRIVKDARGFKFELELTHCDEVDNVKKAEELFDIVNTHDSPNV